MARKARSLIAAVTAVVVVGGAMMLVLLNPSPERSTEPLPLVTETPTAPVGRPLFGNSGPAVATPPSDAPSPDDEAAPGEDTTDLTVPTSIPTETIPSVTPEPGGRLARPVNGPVTSRFGMRLHPVLKVWKLHTGIDFAADCGTPPSARPRPAPSSVPDGPEATECRCAWTMGSSPGTASSPPTTTYQWLASRRDSMSTYTRVWAESAAPDIPRPATCTLR